MHGSLAYPTPSSIEPEQAEADEGHFNSVDKPAEALSDATAFGGILAVGKLYVQRPNHRRRLASALNGVIGPNA